MADIDLRFTPYVILGSAVRIGSDAVSWGDRALIVADAAVEDTASAIQDQLDSLGISAILFLRDGLPSRSEALDEALSLARGSRARMVVSVGGEKVLSLGRLTAALTPSGHHASDVLANPRISNQGLSLLEIPSSGRHSLLYRNEALLSDSDSDRVVLARYPAPVSHRVVIDSALQSRMPRQASILSAASRLSAAAEAFLSPRSSFLADIQSRAALRLAADLCRRVKDEIEDPDFRAKEAESVLLSSLATGLTGAGPGMALSWASSSATHVPGASTQAILLPWVLESPFFSGSARFGEMARIIAGDNSDGAEDPVEEIRSLFGRLGIPGRLRDAGADLGALIPSAEWASEMAYGERADFDEAAFRDILELSC